MARAIREIWFGPEPGCITIRVAKHNDAPEGAAGNVKSSLKTAEVKRRDAKS